MTTILAHKANYTVGRTRKIDRIVVHYTAGNGDTAEGNGKYFAAANRQTSAHYFVDEDSVVQSVLDGDTAWHAGNWSMNCRSIGVEMCSKKDANGNFYIPARTVNNTQYLIKTLMKKYGIDPDGVVRHYDVTGKKCPAPMVDGSKWAAFKAGLTNAPAHPADEPAAWAKTAWEAMTAKGILDGTRPYDLVTRQELAMVLYRIQK